MGKLALVFSLLALGGAGWAVWSNERARPAEGPDGLQAIEGRLAALEREVAGVKAQPTPTPPLSGAPAAGPGGPAASTTDVGSPTAGPHLQGAPRPAATLEERLAALERDSAARSAEGAAARRDGPPQVLNGPVFSMPGYWPTVDAAVKELKLDGVQKSRLEGIVESTQRNLEDLYARPNEDGALWKDVNGGLAFDGGDSTDMMGRVAEHMKKVSSFRHSKVPGTGETYAEAERRIRKDGKDRARSLLDGDQAKAWDRGHPDALFAGPGGGGGMAAVSVFSAPGEVEIVAPGR